MWLCNAVVLLHFTIEMDFFVRVKGEMLEGSFFSLSGYTKEFEARHRFISVHISVFSLMMQIVCYSMRTSYKTTIFQE